MAFRRIPIPKPGVLFGTTKVPRRLQKHAWDSLDMYEVECVCGRVSCIGYCALKAHYHGEALGCHWCRWDDGKAKREKVTVPCKGCGRKLRRIRSTAPMAMCKPCAKRVQRSTNKRYRNSQRGRRCIGCRRTDAQTQWSGLAKLCGGCARQRVRNGQHSCGAPLWRGPKDSGEGPWLDRPLVCRAGCEDSDET